ncbi:MAG: hypothetical protein JSV97_06790, partial [candidate division WOR-3 bacterium]
MYCPQCKAEYRPGITVCADCGVLLVYQLPQDEPIEKPKISPDAQFVELLATYNRADVAIIQSILDDAVITYFFKGERFIPRPFAEPVRLMVKKEEVEETKELLKDLNLRFGASFDAPEKE